MIITDDPETHEIVDGGWRRLRPRRSPSQSPMPATAPRMLPPSRDFHGTPRSRFTETVSAQTCYPLTPTDSCNPFLYPDEGCWVRAHQMKFVIEQKTGIMVWKSWNYGGFAIEILLLKLNTRNRPNCLVKWKYHVAPLVTSDRLWLLCEGSSIFSHIVTQEAWKAVQQYEKSILVNTEGDVFTREFYPVKVSYDPSYWQRTDGLLRYFRDKLKLRSAEKGPPPYRHCPV